MKKSLILCLSILTLVSCSKKEKDFEYTRKISQIEYLNMQQAQQVSANQQAAFKLNNEEKSSGEYVSNLSRDLCQMIQTSSYDNPFLFDAYFSKKVKFQQFEAYMKNILSLSNVCESTQIVFDYNPLFIIKFKLSNPHSLYGLFRVDESGKIVEYYFLSGDDMNIDHRYVKMSDGERISSLVFSKDDKASRVGFIKTPYLHTESFGYYLTKAAGFITQGHNVVIQSNRGSHASSGNFKWLHEKNIQDSKETIDWIRNQTFSNGSVFSFGVSYDGYNALAAAASNAEGLLYTIACSAPANASTDSFTAAETVESSLLAYVAERENHKDINLFAEKINYLVKQGIPYSQFDNILYGRDIADWQDLINARDKGSLNEYMLERSILDELKESHIPIFHVAGTNNDQDGRDTILGHKYLVDEGRYPENNYLYIHHGGHGCGDFLETSFGNEFMNLEFSKLKKEYRTLTSNSQPTSKIDEMFNSINIEVPQMDTSPITNRRGTQLKGETYFTVATDKKIVVNGPLKLKLKAKSSLFKSSLVASLFYSKEGAWEVPHYMTYGISRSSIYFEDSSEGEFSLVLPPMSFTVSAGESIFIQLSLETNSFLDLFSSERQEYYTRNESAGFFEILDKKVELEVQTEVEVQKEEAEEVEIAVENNDVEVMKEAIENMDAALEELN
ncbi:putative peptidase [Halobacteriovorax marinus SJ]|uniref:Peptidase n=1 Tax=Halobacteriovorax marinus (strain ATCC BAA-682 / DSM 15412 / SJ) TaxID=862908 RepID=E1X4S9_HALMS|nr:CocE/NonD family hydrolase [Halobacteriovorax marinus]CBW27155.1 putative peptidase [Halobacteriovorax marinus SJ]